jgi:NADPH-dependent glutamate synthase beta subunit-like oxidoreductase
MSEVSMNKLIRGAIAEPGSSLANKTGSWRVTRPLHQHMAAPCHAICPAGEDAQDWIARFDLGDHRGAWEAIVAANPLPAITGRVCPHPCEHECNRGHYDQPVAIHSLERFLGDMAMAKGWDYPMAALDPALPPVAVVGAGPGGLSAAYHLRRLGLRVTLFEALTHAGGTLRTALPYYRLPNEVLDAETARILALDIAWRPHTKLGRDVDLDELRQDFGAVFMAPGNQKGRRWDVSFAVPDTLRSGLDLLNEWLRIGSVVTPKSVAIVGGGNTGVDLARILKRLGAEDVHIITHERIPGPGVPEYDAMRASGREVRQAIEEGVVVHEHRGVRRLLLKGNKVTGVELVHARKLLSPDGRHKLHSFDGTETVLHVDEVIPAIGQQVDAEGFDSILHGKPFIPVDDYTGAIVGLPGLWAGGDARGDHGTVSAAVGDGRRAALAIFDTLRGLAAPTRPERTVASIGHINLHYYEHLSRQEVVVLPPEQRVCHEEVERGLGDTQAALEAKRCLACGNCMACDNCWTLCPDASVLKTTEIATDGSHYVFDYDYCKGCGLCAKECPTGYIIMQPEF